MQSSVPDPVFLNVEFIFSWLWGHIISPIFSQGFLSFLEILASILLIAGITIVLYCLVRLYEIKQEDAKKAAKEKAASSTPTQISTASAGQNDTLPGAAPIEQSVPRNETWESIRGKLLSETESDWRIGIIEADIYLDRVLDIKGVPGDTLGDKLKNVSPSILPSVQVAWEAHKVRNRIAHDGADFSLTMPEVRRVYSYFEIVFRDLGVIA